MPPCRVQALLFDLDGTLIDSSQDIADSLNYVLKGMGLPARSKAEVERFVGDGVRTLLVRSIGSDDEALIGKAAETFKNHYLVHCIDETVLYPGVETVLDLFKAKKKAVISNKPCDMVVKTLEHFGIARHFNVVMGAESAKARKPDPEPVLKALEKLGVPPGEAIMIGDGTTDIRAGKAAGAFTCAATYGYRARAELQAFGPDYFIDRMEDLKAVVA